MLENEKLCSDIVQQLHAVEKAITNAKRTLILDHCLEEVVHTVPSEQDLALNEFKAITKHL